LGFKGWVTPEPKAFAKAVLAPSGYAMLLLSDMVTTCVHP